jgi:AcrR family transcriptional regulator
MLAQSPERAGIPSELVSAYVGAVQEITRTRLLQGRQDEMPAVMDELWSLIGSYRPPTEPLRPSGRKPPRREEGLEAHDHAERAIRAFAVVVAEKGYVATTVDEVVRRASMSATTFYAQFHGKKDVMAAAIDSASAQMLAAIQPAVRRAPDWPQSIRAGFAALFNFLASRPALARLIVVEVYAAGPAAVMRRSENLQPLEALLAKGLEHTPKAPKIAVEATAAVVYSLSYRRIRDAGPESLPGLAPICTYIALAPFIGAEEAAVIANESGRPRPASLS